MRKLHFPKQFKMIEVELLEAELSAAVSSYTFKDEIVTSSPNADMSV